MLFLSHTLHPNTNIWWCDAAEKHHLCLNFCDSSLSKANSYLIVYKPKVVPGNQDLQAMPRARPRAIPKTQRISCLWREPYSQHSQGAESLPHKSSLLPFSPTQSPLPTVTTALGLLLHPKQGGPAVNEWYARTSLLECPFYHLFSGIVMDQAWGDTSYYRFSESEPWKGLWRPPGPIP